MPIYTYRREDGTTFDVRQKFSDDALKVDPQTGQKIHRIPQASGIVFRGSGFYVTDNNKASRAAISSTAATPSTSDASNAAAD